MAAFRDVRGRVALVTGAGRGIGRAIAFELTRLGAKVAVCDLESGPADAVAEELIRLGREARSYVFDVSRAEDFAAVAGRVERDLGEIDILVNNAGLMSLGPFLDQPSGRNSAQVRVNFEGVIHGLRAVLPRMRARRRGHVLNVSSLSGRIGTPYAAVYSGTKFAVVGLTEALRAELRGSGIDFTYVLPALVDTELLAGAGRPAWPPVVSPQEVASVTVDAIRTKQVDVFVPRLMRLLLVLPAILPRFAVDLIGRRLRVDRMFARIDEEARAAYSARIDRLPSPVDEEPQGPFGPTPRARA